LVSEAKEGNFRDYEIGPEDFGFKRAKLGDLTAAGVEDNCDIALKVLKGVPGPKRDIVLINSGCAIYAADSAASIPEGIKLAAESIDSGKAMKKLELLKEYSHK
jgi:anthranilate phosphoribosyltransferase